MQYVRPDWLNAVISSDAVNTVVEYATSANFTGTISNILSDENAIRAIVGLVAGIGG